MTATHLADTSVAARMSVRGVREVVEPLTVNGKLATCAVVDLEVGYSARTREDHLRTIMMRRALPRAAITEAVLDRAIEVQGLLAKRGQHRMPISDLIIAAAAEADDLTVLHYDKDFDLIADVTGQPTAWVVPRGSI